MSNIELPDKCVAQFLDNKMYIGRKDRQWVLTPVYEEAHTFLTHAETRRAAYIVRSGYPYEIRPAPPRSLDIPAATPLPDHEEKSQ